MTKTYYTCGRETMTNRDEDTTDEKTSEEKGNEERGNDGIVVVLHKENDPDFSVEESAFETVGVSVENAVSVNDLQELVDSWRYENAQPARQQGAYQVAEAFEKCADELEELIND